MTRFFTRPVATALLVAGLLLLPALAGAADREPVARPSIGAAAIDWQPAISSYDRLVLTVSGPGGNVVSREFQAGETPTFSVYDANGQARPDGVYQYELRVVPHVDAQVRKKLRAYRETGDRSILAE